MWTVFKQMKTRALYAIYIAIYFENSLVDIEWTNAKLLIIKLFLLIRQYHFLEK